MILGNSVQVLGSATPDEEAVRAELEAILNSPGFLRSDRQSRFLRYVCETALKGEGAKLNEYVLAHDVFGRGTSYSPGEDSVVRRQAHSLRQKLHEHYEHAGARSKIRIDIPSGRYVPVFSRVDQASGQPSELAPLSEVAAPAVGDRTLHATAKRRSLSIISIGALCLVIGFGLGTWRSRSSQTIDQAVAEIWGPWLSDPAGAVICLSNPLTAVVKQFSFELPLEAHLNPPRMVVNTEQAEAFRRYFELQPGGHFYMYPAISQSKMGETLGAATLVAMLTRAGLPVHLTQSRFLSWDSFRNQNLILMGHDEANRWLDPILNKLPMRMVTTRVDKPRHIAVSAAAGAKLQEFYLEVPEDLHSTSRDYALVSMLPGIDEKHQLLLVNGLNTEGTQIAMEYLSDPKRLRELLSRLHGVAPAHKGNWRFQFILRTEVRDQVPVNAELLVVTVL